MKNVTNLVSIIIPVYNSELYLDECINSILKQTYVNIECILVNDGSKDSSGNICDYYKRSDNRVKVIHQDNRGVSSARNRGLKEAKGDWIMFIDSDDWVDIDIVEKSLQYESDIISWNHFKEYPSKQVMIHINPHEITRRDNDIKYFIMGLMVPHYDKIINNVDITINHTRSSCSKLFKSNIIKGLIFSETLPLAEDAFFCFQAYERASSITFLNTPAYHYRTNLDSAIHKYRENIEEINQSILKLFIDNKSTLLNNKELSIFNLGLIYECINNSLIHKYIYNGNILNIRKNVKSFKTNATYINQDKKYYEYKKYFPIHQRIAIYLYMKRYFYVLFMFTFIKQSIRKMLR